MTEGVFSIRTLPLEDLQSLSIGRAGRWYEFGIRWSDGEICPDILAVETDGYDDLEDVVSFKNEVYRLEFGEDLLSGVLKSNAIAEPEGRVNFETALRYAVEFDAFLEVGSLPVGGKWSWGGGRGRPKQRDPSEFARVWLQ